MNTPSPALPSPSPATPGNTAQELLERVAVEGDRAPRELIDACAAQGEPMVGALRRLLEDEHTWDAIDGVWWLPVHAGLILGLMPSESAGVLLADLMRMLNAHEADDLQDWLAELWPILFQNKPPRAIDAVRALAEDPAVDWFTLSEALDVILTLAHRRGETAIEPELDWTAALAADESRDGRSRAWAACALLSFPRARHRGLLDKLAALEERRHGTDALDCIFSHEDVDIAFAEPDPGRQPPWFGGRLDPWSFYDPAEIDARQQRWSEENAGYVDEYDGLDTDAWIPMPYVRATPKIGRNDPCPCGSGKKYKHCCLGKQPA